MSKMWIKIEVVRLNLSYGLSATKKSTRNILMSTASILMMRSMGRMERTAIGSKVRVSRAGDGVGEAQGQMSLAIRAQRILFKSSYADLVQSSKRLKTLRPTGCLMHNPICETTQQELVRWLMHSSGQWLEQDYTLPVGKFDAQVLARLSPACKALCTAIVAASRW